MILVYNYFVDLGRTDFATFDWRTLFEVSEYQNDGKRSVDTIKYPALMKFVFEEMIENKQPIVIFSHQPYDIENLLTELLTPECNSQVAVIDSIENYEECSRNLLKALAIQEGHYCYVGEADDVNVPIQFVEFKEFISSIFVSEESIAKRVHDASIRNLFNEHVVLLCQVALQELIVLCVKDASFHQKQPSPSLLFSLYNTSNLEYKVLNCRSLRDVSNIIETLSHSSLLRKEFAETQEEMNSDLQKMINSFASKPIADIK